MNTRQRLGRGWARLRLDADLGAGTDGDTGADAQQQRSGRSDHSRRGGETASSDRRAHVGNATASARTSINQFARRAANELGDGSVLDVGPEAGRFRQLFDDRRYETMAVGPPLPGPDVGRPVRTRPVGVLPLPTEGFEVVLCTGVLERSPEPQALLTELNRLMRPGGRLFLSAPLIVPEPVPEHLPNRARFGLNYLIEAAGFSIGELQPVYRARTYAVVADKHRRPGQRRRSTD